MARFRNNLQWMSSTTLLRRPGLAIKRARMINQQPVVPAAERWRSWTIELTLSGTRYLSIANRTYCQLPTTLLWGSPQTEDIRVRYLPGASTDRLSLVWTADGWAQFLAEHPLFAERQAALLAQPAPVLALRYATPPLLRAARQLLSLAALPQVAAAALENAATILLTFVGASDFAASLSGYGAIQARCFEQAQELMIARLGRPLSISAIAGALHISPRQLQRDFLACTGLSPVAYLQMLRLSEANMLLASTTLPIGTIAARLGYANAAHFSAAFRRLYHCTPSQIREQREDAQALATMEDVYGCQY
ncbi:MAG TPA: helix-turn-helix transcriptional regulator [Herpetosiphonaceae bacterium]|nr:helix-turn-helix transcriptional regulator [Herpetosiphonaceae bacterium]